jgi:spore germination cell wall hydrolase CwlJ-like protein
MAGGLGGLGGLGEQDFDLIARTMLGEAANQPLEGQEAVGHVIMNRLKSGRYGSSVPDVLFAPKQFTPWMTRRDELMAIPTTSPRYQQALDIAKSVGRGLRPDLTGGALNFANYAAADPVNQRGWVGDMVRSGNAVKIGDHWFGTAPGAGAELADIAARGPVRKPANGLAGTGEGKAGAISDGASATGV